MKLFLDTANLQEIEEGVSLGVVDGVTTNPSLLAKESSGMKRHVLEICRLVPGIVSAEVLSTDTEAMIAEGLDIASWAENIAVKVPMIPPGIKAVKELSRRGVKVNVTLVFSPNQALLAAKAGAYIVSPFVGRLDDIGHDGMDLVQSILEIYRRFGIETQVLTASIRHPHHVVRAAKMGSHIASMPYKVFEAMFKHPLTDIGLERFLNDWRKAQAAKELVER